MARLYTEGFERGNTISLSSDQTTFSVSGSSTTISSGVTHAGSFSCKIDATVVVSSVSSSANTTFAGSAIDVVYARFYVHIASYPGVSRILYALRNGATQRVGLNLGTTGNLSLTDEDGTISSAFTNLSTGQWYCIEVKADRSAAGGSHVVECRVDEAVLATSNTRNISTGFTNVQIGFTNASADTAGILYLDDIAINDNSGSDQNSYPGVGYIATLRPNAAGDINTWDKSNGAAGSSTNFQNLDESVPNDATDYVRSTTQDQEDMYNITSPTFNNLATVTLVQANVRYRGSSSSSTPGFKLQVKKDTGATIAQGSEITPNSTSFSTNANASPLLPTLTLYNDPDGNPWTADSLTTTQMGMKLTTDSTNRAEVSTVWLNVEYIPVVGGVDTITVSESVNASLESNIPKSDSITISEAINVSLVHQPQTSDSITVTESVNLQLMDAELAVIVSDNISVSESINDEESIQTQANDSVTVTEAFTMSLDSFIKPSDSLTVTESINTSLEDLPSVEDTITISENINVALVHQIAVSDEVTVAENKKVELESQVVASDSIVVSETVEVSAPDLNVLVSESITISESIGNFLSLMLTIQDSITVDESVKAELESLLTVQDSISVTEALQVISELNIDVRDFISVADPASLKPLDPLRITVSETVTLAESINNALVHTFSVSDEVSVSEDYLSSPPAIPILIYPKFLIVDGQLCIKLTEGSIPYYTHI